MASLLIRDLDTVVTCDDADSVLRHVDLYCEDGRIRAIGPDLAVQADEVLDGSHLLCYPGLINTHHHLYQQFSRNLPEVQNLELFPWLKALYEIWKNLDTEVVHGSSLTGMGELMKNGCTTCFDHHSVFPAGCGDLLGAQFAAADELGMRMVASRGSMDLSVKDGGLPPDSVVQSVDAILEDSAALIERWHDPSYGSMRQIALAPCSPFSVSRELLLQSAKLARQYHVRLHTHLAETKDEERYTLDRYGLRPLAYLESLGWVGPDVWFAHGIHFTEAELDLLAETGTGVAHCPVSNMKLSSGVAHIPEMLQRGIHVGDGVVHDIVHIVAEARARLMEARRVDEHELRVLVRDDAADAVARRLRLMGNNGDLFANEVVDERRFTDVRPPHDRDHGRFLAHGFSPMVNSKSAC